MVTRRWMRRMSQTMPFSNSPPRISTHMSLVCLFLCCCLFVSLFFCFLCVLRVLGWMLFCPKCNWLFFASPALLLVPDLYLLLCLSVLCSGHACMRARRTKHGGDSWANRCDGCWPRGDSGELHVPRVEKPSERTSLRNVSLVCLACLSALLLLFVFCPVLSLFSFSCCYFSFYLSIFVCGGFSFVFLLFFRSLFLHYASNKQSHTTQHNTQ